MRRGFPFSMASAFLALALLGSCTDGGDGATDPIPSGPQALDEPAESCDPYGFTEAALVPAGPLDEISSILPNGRRVSPDGVTLHVGGYPARAILSSDGAFAYVVQQKDGVLVIDVAAQELVQNLQTAAGRIRGFRGLDLSADGSTLWVMGMYGLLHRVPVNEDGTLDGAGAASVELDGFMVEARVNPVTGLVYAMASTNSDIYEIDPNTLETLRSLKTDQNPYGLAFSADGSELYASNLSVDSVSVFDLDAGELVALVPVCAGPEGLALRPGTTELFVACSNSDEVAVVDTAARSVVRTFDLSGDAEQLVGAAVREVSFSHDASRLHVAAARRNKIDIVDPDDGTVYGSVATGHYPGAARALPDGTGLVVPAMKGLGSQNSLWDIRGQVNLIPLPQSEDALALATQRVRENNERPTNFFPESCGGELPPALAGGEDRPIKHVVLIVRENKTYDNVLGDLEGANGDPALTIFGEEITPNIHALARSFVNLDNYYADAEHSLQGHQWVTQADCNDFTEQTRRFLVPLLGFDAAAESGGGTFFDHCFVNGVSFRNYGEVVGFGRHLMGQYEAFIDHKYPFFTLAIPDVEKAAEFIREFDQGIFPEFVFIVLPNDHTFGSDAGKPTPAYMVGDNDAGTGMLVEAISSSEYWPETAIFIIEDDAQSSGDHVNAHRSIGVVVSPHVRRGYTSSVHYSMGSTYHTIELMLGLPSLNRNTAEAPPMIDLFVTDTPGDEPDFTPYVALPNPVSYEENTDKSPMAAESAAIDWSEPDGAPGLGLILWRVMRGDEPIPEHAKRIED